ncbi:MAG: dienelactone hydrolase family protein [Desulfobacteraceae bacterium]|nr:dienelactone hydrolase family protein [Desulfobacteraceae bacterium]
MPLHRAVAGSVPPGEAEAKAALDKSPRHHEWAVVTVAGTEMKLNAFIAYPERKDKAPVVVVIHEIFGLTDWIRGVTDRLAADGFIAIAPDLLSGMGPGGGGTESFPSRDDVVKAVRNLASPQVVAMLDAVKDYAVALPAASGKFASVGFCWGGTQSFYYATAQPRLGAAAVYYGSPPPTEMFSSISAPVMGFYGEDDARVTSTVESTEHKMKELGKAYSARIYKGTGHGFLRAQADREGANREASSQAWPATIDFLNKSLSQK